MKQKPRDPSAHLRSKGALRIRVVEDKRKKKPKKARNKYLKDHTEYMDIGYAIKRGWI